MSRSPSPLPRGVGSPRIGGGAGGWSSPGLNTGSGSGTASPRSGGDHHLYSQHTLGPSGLSWAAAKAKSEQVRGYPSFSTRNSGFFSRQKRRISASLPRFRLTATTDSREQEKFERSGGASGSRYGGVGYLLRSRLRQTRYRLFLLVFVVWILYLRFWDGMHFYGVYGYDQDVILIIC
jgi:mannan polymerase II complex MNN10 subunit